MRVFSLPCLTLLITACGGGQSGIPDGAPGAADAAKGPADANTSTCGTCPSGYHCGKANGLAVCRNDTTQIPLFSHIFVIAMENISWDTLSSDSPSNSPFLHGLMNTAAYATDYHGVAHPSLPNYIALISGGTQGVACDCNPTGGACNGGNCNLVLSSCGCPQYAQHLGDQLGSSPLAWRAYGEDMAANFDGGTTAACLKESFNGYATRHIPFLYFLDVQGDTSPTGCAAHVVDFSQFATDSASTATTPRFVFIAPNLTHDMHDPAISLSHTKNINNGDTWLASVVPTITALDAYRNGGLIVLWWDEDDYSGVTAPDDPIPMFVLSPYAKTNYPGTSHADHYSMLATFEDGLGLPRLGSAASATPLTDYFPAQ